MKILIAEDDTVSRLVLAATLKAQGHEVTAVTNGEEAWQSWQEYQFSMVISDWIMPDVDGLELCQRIRNTSDGQHAAHYTYVILLTARGGKTNYLDAMDAGADDFITKPFDADELAARLRVADRILDLHAALRLEARHDVLTGLWNRAAILDSLKEELERAMRTNTDVVVLLVDLDHFKAINDTHGHGMGDTVLSEAGRRMKQSLRIYDKIGRYGGEEFLMILPHCTKVEAVVIADRMRHHLSAIPMHGTVQLTVTASIGIAIASADWQEQHLDAEILVRHADEALYRAKANGRNRVEIYG